MSRAGGGGERHTNGKLLWSVGQPCDGLEKEVADAGPQRGEEAHRIACDAQRAYGVRSMDCNVLPNPFSFTERRR